MGPADGDTGRPFPSCRQSRRPLANGRKIPRSESATGSGLPLTQDGLGGKQRGAGSGPRLLNSNRRRKEADRECEQHEAAERIDRDVNGTDHLKITELVTVASGLDFLNEAIQSEPWFQPGFVGSGKWFL
jgi:hypothetical protein